MKTGLDLQRIGERRLKQVIIYEEKRKQNTRVVNTYRVPCIIIIFMLIRGSELLPTVEPRWDECALPTFRKLQGGCLLHTSMILASRLCYSMYCTVCLHIYSADWAPTGPSMDAQPYELFEKKKTRNASKPSEHHTQSGGKVVKTFTCRWEQ